MKNMGKIKTVAYTIAGILIIVLLLFVGVRENLIKSTDIEQDTLMDIDVSSVQVIELDEAPLGVAEEYIFTLPEITHDLSLMFCSSHCYADVYMDGAIVYSLRPSPEIASVKTTSAVWNIVHVCHEDSGKEFRVVLMPVYENFLNQDITFTLGNIREMMLVQVTDSLGEVIVTCLATIIGLLFVVFGIYFRIKTKGSTGLIALGMLALSLGLWRFFDFSFISFFIREKLVFAYYISLTMLMISMIPFLESVKKAFRKSWQKYFDILGFIISLTSITQLALQFLGIFSLREMLTVTHVTVIISLVLTAVCLVAQLIKPAENEKRKFNLIYILVIGISLDLLLFYALNSSTGLMFSIIALLVYVIGEGIRFVVTYVENEEKLHLSEIKLAQNEKDLAQARFTTMMSQIRSHFIFNILNAISGMCKYDPEKADRTIVHFAKFLRSNIDIMQNDDLVHFHNALRHIEDYVALEQVRYGDSIQFETDIQVDDFLLPPLVMQPLVENAIIHGLVPKKGGGTITLRTRKDNENIYITVEDNGLGFDDKMNISEKSIGMQNVRFRLDHMVKGTLKTESISGIGTKATIIIPNKEAEK